MESWPESVAICLALLATLQICITIIGSWRRAAARRRKEHLTIQVMMEDLERVRDQRAAEDSTRRPAPWKGWRPLMVARKQDEGGDICSFYLEDANQGSLPAFVPGQFLTVRVPAQPDGKNAVRCYSLSEYQRDDHYRISVKRARGEAGNPAGVVSNFMHDAVGEGTVIEVQPPKGAFVLDPKNEGTGRLTVLIAGGVGITPLLSMLEGLLASDTPSTPVIMFYGVRDGEGHAMKGHLSALAAEHPDQLSLKVCYSRPSANDRLGVDYQHHGPITTDLVFRTLEGQDADFFLCGPASMMETMVPELRSRGVPEGQVHYEAFGPASVPGPDGPSEEPPASAETGGSVTFTQEGQRVSWDGSQETILDAAEAAGVTLEAGCRQGHCGTCEVPLIEGRVRYLAEPQHTPEEGACLTCLSAPVDDVVLDA